MSVGMKRRTLGLASIAALGIGLVAGSTGDFGMSQTEAASPEQYSCREANRFERSVFGSAGPSPPGALDEETNRVRSFEKALVLCGNSTVCGEFSDYDHQLQVPMAIWNGVDNCGVGEFGLPSL